MDDLYRRLFDEIPCYISAQGRDFRIIASNDIFRRDFGGEVGSYCYEVYKGRSDKCPECPVEKTFQDGKVHSSEEMVRRRDGDEVYVIVYTSPIKDDNGEINAVVEISTDITHVKQLQQKYRTLFEEVPCYISVQDRDLKIVAANRRFATDFGDGIGESCYEVYKHRTEPCLDCPVVKTFQDGEIHTSEEVVTSRSGKHENVLCYTDPIRDAEGKITTVMEMSTNITELRQLQSQLASLGLIVSSVSHGIKGLLSGLDGGIYMVETGFNKDKKDRVTKGWEMIKRNVDRIRSMVLNILYFAKDRDAFWQPMDLEELTSSVESVLASRADAVGVRLRVEAEQGSFECDHTAVHSLLVNMLENSIDACRVDKKNVDHRVDLVARVDGGQVVFDITDNGIGMDQETREKAFSLFFSSKGAEGTGLGLFIAHKIAKSHHGTIDIDSSPGVGTRFVVRLPKEQPSKRAI